MHHTTRKRRERLLYITQAGLVAAIYTVLTVFVGALGLAGGAIQFRISEALCVLPFFTPAAIPGLTIGCLISNLYLGLLWQDIVFGTLATLIGAYGAHLLRRIPYLVPLPTVLANTLTLPLVLAYAYRAEEGLPILFVTVGLGELLSAGFSGTVLLSVLKRYDTRIFRGCADHHKKERRSNRSMQEKIPQLPPQVLAAIDALERSGCEAYAVGGCVRDTLLGKAPNDWDITTSARPDETAKVFADCRLIETGIKHGTLTVILDGMPLEITTYRSDGEYADNRHPIRVSFSDHIEDDLSRRDFTVNAMAYHPTRGFVDLFGGVTDLERRTIACVGDPETRFYEDGLRILRALRFASVLDFEIDPPTARAIHNCKHLLSNIAAERIREELCKLICGRGAVRILREFSDVIGECVPEITHMVGFEQNSRYHCHDVWEHTLHALAENHGSDLVTRLTILLHDIGKPHCYTEDELGGHFKGHGPIGTEMTEVILRRLKFDNATTERVTRLVERHDLSIPAETRAVKRLMQHYSDEDILRLLEVQRCDRLAHAEEHSAPSPALAVIPAIIEELRRSEACLSLKTLAVKGNDLMALGIPAGKQLGKVLTELLDAVIDERLPNEKNALLEYAKKYV